MSRKLPRLPRIESARGFTLLETLVAFTVFSMLLAITGMVFVSLSGLARNSESKASAGHRLKKTILNLERDFSQASDSTVGLDRVPGKFSGAFEGDAFWFLSAEDPATGEMVRNAEGEPLWQRNILYYLVVPSDQSGSTFHTGPGGYDDGCHQKVLVKQVIDIDPSDVPESLISDIQPYLVAPAGSAFPALGPGAESAQILGTNLLWFRIYPDPEGMLSSRQVDLRAVSTEAAQRRSKGQPSSYFADPLTKVVTTRITARN